jgi:hypothetical protein
MSSVASIASIASIEPAPVKVTPNVVDVGAWLNRAKALREPITDYVPRHRAPGPAV